MWLTRNPYSLQAALGAGLLAVCISERRDPLRIHTIRHLFLDSVRVRDYFRDRGYDHDSIVAVIVVRIMMRAVIVVCIVMILVVRIVAMIVAMMVMMMIVVRIVTVDRILFMLKRFVAIVIVILMIITSIIINLIVVPIVSVDRFLVI